MTDAPGIPNGSAGQTFNISRGVIEVYNQPRWVSALMIVIKLDLSERLYQRLKEQAGKIGQPPEVVALRCLEEQMALQTTEQQTQDPIARFIGAFNSGISDLGTNHDEYIRQGLLSGLRGGPDSGVE